MSRKKSLEGLLMGTALISLPTFSQEGGPENRPEASVQFLGTFLKQTDNNGVSRPPPMVAAFWPATASSSPSIGVEVNYG